MNTTGLRLMENDVIQIRVQLDGKVYTGIFPYPPTQTNLRAAAAIREKMLDALRRGTFSYADFFPDSRLGQRQRAAMRIAERTLLPTFAVMAEKYLDAKRLKLAESTVLSYEQTLNRYFMEPLGPRLMDEITYEDLNAELAIFSEHSAKTFNNALIQLRGVFAHWHANHAKGKPNPARLLSNRKGQQAKPDPFKVEEMEAIIAYMHQHYPAHVANMFEFAFLTGVRPGELIALLWSDMDEQKMTIAVKRARVMGKDQNHTKTYNARLIDLTQRAMEVLKRQKVITGFLNGHIFLTYKNQPYIKTNRLREEFWVPALQALGLSYRVPYQTRHTYATTCLAAGMNQTYLSRQMGHASLQMLLEVYADWINTADNKVQIAKLDQYLAEKPSAQKGNEAVQADG